MIEFKCGQCGAEMEAPQSQAGGVERCPQCGSPNRVPKLARPATVAPEPPAGLSQAAPTVPHAGPLSNGPAARSARNRKPLLILAAIAGVVAVAAVGGFLAGHIGRSNPLQSKSVAGDQAPLPPAAAAIPASTQKPEASPVGAASQTTPTGPLAARPPTPPSPPVGTISGAAWLNRNNGSSDIQRGLTISVIRGKVAKPLLRSCLEKEIVALQKQAADFEASSGSDSAQAKEDHRKIAEVQSAIGQLPNQMGVQEVQTLLRNCAPFGRYGVSLFSAEVVPANTVKQARTGLEGKYTIDGLADGDYFLHAFINTDVVFVEWIIPVNVTAGATATVDLFNDNAFINY